MIEPRSTFYGWYRLRGLLQQRAASWNEAGASCACADGRTRGVLESVPAADRRASCGPSGRNRRRSIRSPTRPGASAICRNRPRPSDLLAWVSDRRWTKDLKVVVQGIRTGGKKSCPGVLIFCALAAGNRESASGFMCYPAPISGAPPAPLLSRDKARVQLSTNESAGLKPLG